MVVCLNESKQVAGACNESRQLETSSVDVRRLYCMCLAVSFCAKVPSDLKQADMQLQVEWWYEVGFRIFPYVPDPLCGWEVLECKGHRKRDKEVLGAQTGRHPPLRVEIIACMCVCVICGVRRLKNIVSVLEAEANVGERERERRM